jgi:hypothetical protein
MDMGFLFFFYNVGMKHVIDVLCTLARVKALM